MNDFLDRLQKEKSELDERRGKLVDFLSSPNFRNIDPTQQILLKVQSTAMATYSQILTERLSHLGV